VNLTVDSGWGERRPEGRPRKRHRRGGRYQPLHRDIHAAS
jgi:hypothetical protein